MSRICIFQLFLLFALFLVACGSPAGRLDGSLQAAPLATNAMGAVKISDQDSTTLEPKGSESADPGLVTTLHEEPPESCPVTQSPDPVFIPPPPYPESAPYKGRFWYGTEELWTLLPIDGTWRQLAHGEKVFWWRQGFDGSQKPQPELAMTARRLDGPAPEAHSGPPATNAYHRDFHWAMLLGFTVETPGCWEVTGSNEGHELSFVVWVAP